MRIVQNGNRDELVMHGINGIAKIQVGFSITDEGNNSIYTGPKEIETSIAEGYDYSKEKFNEAIANGVLSVLYGYKVDYTSSDVIYNKNDIKIVSETLITNSDGEAGLILEIENNSSNTIYASTSNILANGVTLYDSTWSYDTISAGKKLVLTMSLTSMLDDSTLEEASIKKISNIAFTFNASDDNDNKVIPSEEISIDIKK